MSKTVAQVEMNSSEREIRRQYHHSCREDRSFPMTLREYRTAVVHEKEEWSGALDWKGACIIVYEDNSTDTENTEVIEDSSNSTQRENGTSLSIGSNGKPIEVESLPLTE